MKDFSDIIDTVIKVEKEYNSIIEKLKSQIVNLEDTISCLKDDLQDAQLELYAANNLIDTLENTSIEKSE